MLLGGVWSRVGSLNDLAHHSPPLSTAPRTPSTPWQSPRARPRAALQLMLWVPYPSLLPKTLHLSEPSPPPTPGCCAQTGAGAAPTPSWSLRGSHLTQHHHTAWGLLAAPVWGCSVPWLCPVSPRSCLCPPHLALPTQPWGAQPQALPVPGASPHRQGGCAPIKPVASAEGFSSFNGLSWSMYNAVTPQSSPGALGLSAGWAGVQFCPPGQALALPVPGWDWGLLFLPASPGTRGVPCRCRICACSTWWGCPAGLRSAVNVPVRVGVLPPAPGGS